MAKIKNITQLLAESKLITNIEEEQQKHKFQPLIAQFMPSEFCENFLAKEVKDNILRIDVENAMQRFTVLAKMNEILALVQKIHPHIEKIQVFISPNLNQNS